jgi:hypothetical protein
VVAQATKALAGDLLLSAQTGSQQPAAKLRCDTKAGVGCISTETYGWNSPGADGSTAVPVNGDVSSLFVNPEVSLAVLLWQSAFLSSLLLLLLFSAAGGRAYEEGGGLRPPPSIVPCYGVGSGYVPP